MDHVTNIHGEFRKADIHLGASCSSSFCLLNHYHTAHVLCIALNLSLPVATHGHEPSNVKKDQTFAVVALIFLRTMDIILNPQHGNNNSTISSNKYYLI